MTKPHIESQRKSIENLEFDTRKQTNTETQQEMGSFFQFARLEARDKGHLSAPHPIAHSGCVVNRQLVSRRGDT